LDEGKSPEGFDAQVEASREKAYKAYPDLLVGGSALHAAARAIIQNVGQQNSEFLKNPDWPLVAAKMAVEQVAKGRGQRRERREAELRQIRTSIQSDEYALDLSRRMGGRPKGNAPAYDNLVNERQKLKPRENSYYKNKKQIKI